MLRIVTGPFHPDLENAVVEEIRQCKAADPFTPIALIVPSGPLLTRLRERLILLEGLSLLNVHFLTFHQLALRLYEERIGLQESEDASARLELAQDFFFQYLLGQIGRRELPGVAALGLRHLPPGGRGALWSTIRDLKDSAVVPEVALRAVAEGVFDAEDASQLQAVFTLYAAVLETSRALGVGAIDDLASLMISRAPASRFLDGLQQVYYYGFYDLTQVQLSLFEAVAAAAPVTLFFPLHDDPAWGFAKRFFERHLHPLVSSSKQVAAAPTLADARQSPTQDVRVMNAVGVDDELTLVCKEILTLVETHGYGFEDIGVVARSLTLYSASLHRLFTEHRIPFTSTAVAPVIREPAAKVLLRLAWLPLSGFARAAVLDVVTSRFYRIDAPHERIEPRPDLWHLAVSALGIRRGEEDWRRLASAETIAAQADDAEEAEQTLKRRVRIPTAQVRLLWHAVSALMEDCRALPTQGGMGELTDAFVALATKHLALPGLSQDESEPDDSDSDRLAILSRAFRAIVQQLLQLDRVSGMVSWEEWANLFERALEEAAIPIEADNHRGVRVLDAMAARGLPFRALFLIGLNEKVFPRFIQEDAFLRDRARRVLDETLGYKIDEKLTGYDEEQLLFALLQQAARNRLYLLYQRADTDGRPLVPSPYLAPYLAAWQRAGNGNDRTVFELPRRLSDRLDLPHFAPALLTPNEMALRLVFEHYDATAWLNATGREGELFRNGVEALRELEGGLLQLGAHDGVLGPLDEHWERICSAGLAPTPLEQYARCPFQYYARQILKLEPMRQPPIEELPAQAFGELCHAVLPLCYARLIDMGWPQTDLPPLTLYSELTSAADEVFTAYETQYGTGYGLIWDMAKDTVIALVRALLEIDQQEYRESGFRPVGFEVEAEGTLLELDEEFGALKLRGRLDRVDQRDFPPAIRVIDYKFKQGREMKDQDRNLKTAAIRGFRLQPPLYAWIKVQDLLPEQVEFRFLAPRWEKAVDESRFDRSVWDGAAGRQLRQTFRTLLQGIRSGRFFILPVPEGYCDYCEMSPACRRFHGPTWRRQHAASHARELHLLRKQKVTDE